MRRLWLLVLCLFCFAVTARAAEVPETLAIMETTVPDTGADAAEPVVLIGLAQFETYSSWPYVNQLILLEETASLEDVLRGADYQSATYTDTEGKNHQVAIRWELSEEDLSQPGFHVLQAYPVPEAGMVLAEGFDGVLSWPMYRKGGGAPLEVIPMYGPTTTDALIAQGSPDPLSELTIVTKNKRCALWENGWWNTTNEILWTWDVSRLDVSTLGKQTLSGRITGMPDWLTIPEAHRGGEVAVFVVPSDRIELCAPTNLSRNGILKFEWIYSTDTVSEACLERKTDTGDWEDCEAAWYAYRKAGLFTNGNLQLRLLDIPPGEYCFRLSYLDTATGEPVRRYTRPLTITVPENLEALISTDGTVPEELDIGGDRDGGDSDGEKLPDYSQPAPTYPEEEPGVETEPTEETKPAAVTRPTTAPAATRPTETTPAPALEWVTDSFTDLSGMRLKVLTELGDTVLFEKEGISVEIPSKLLEGLKLEDFDLLEVVILRPEYGEIRLSVLKNGEPVTDLTGTTIYVPWTGENPARCSGEQGNTIPMTAEGNLLRLSVDAPGAYRFSEPEEPTDPVQTEALAPEETQPAPEYVEPKKEIPGVVLFLFPVLILLLLLAVIALWRRLRYE